jgi:hypothetical protein
MIEEKKLYPITILGLNRRELEIFSQYKMMIAKDLLDIDVNEFARRTKIPIKRLLMFQRLVNQIIS